MLKTLLMTLALSMTASILAAQTVLQGKVTDDKGEELIGATVRVLKGTDFVRGAATDAFGNFRIQLDPGTYNVEVTYSGVAMSRTTGVQVILNKLNTLDVVMSNSVLTEVDIVAYKVELIEQDKTSGGQTLTAETIRNLPTRSVNQIVATTAGTTSVDGGAINIKGSRSNATNYYIDGIRVAGTPPPVQDIEQLQVITGGLGAEYGDVTGGVISVVTKGPASEYHGALEVESSYGLDPYGWLLTTGNLSGPILKKTRPDGSKRTVIGFRLSGQYLDQKDDDPPAIPVYRVKDDVLRRLEATPLVRRNGQIFNYAESFTQDSVDALRFNPFERRRDLDVTSRLDFRFTESIDFSVTGTYKYIANQFTPSRTLTVNESTQAGWRVFNSHNNPTQYNDRYRIIGRLRHRLGADDGDKAISNVNYQIQFGFERGTGRVADARHGDRLFDYGFVGRFNFQQVPIFGIQDGQIRHVDYLEAFTGFQPGYVDNNGVFRDPNPGLNAYNLFANPENPFSYIATNGQFQGVYDDVWAGMHTNVNLPFNSFSKNQNDIITIIASSGFDLKLGRTGVHNIQFGLINEQRVDRSYGVSPYRLWLLMRQNANSHFNGLDTNRIVGIDDMTGLPIYGNLATQPSDLKFYRAIREKLGLQLDEFVNPQALNPDDLSIDMFSSRELTTLGIVNYQGYDHTGRLTPNGVTFNDFFTSTGPDGVRNFPVAPLRPVWQGAYLKDKFQFNKMIFSLGVRVEQIDLNTRVMRDQYSLYQIQEARAFFQSNPGFSRPDGIGDDFKVYVESPTDQTPKAFRKGNVWYNKDGVQVNDANIIFGGGVIAPVLADEVVGGDITDPRFDPNTSFEDYKPQLNWMPRLAFSFPISKEANFFAHYDILVQRPPGQWQVTPLDYFYFYVPGRTSRNNANLRPERVVDYEVGFQQLLTKNTAIKLQAYYRELRDMIQSRVVLYVPVIGRYETFGNIDFGTVKGFTAQYEMRRKQNIEMRLAYTLQFADGTGSDPETQRSLAQFGNLRTLFPLSFDERHNLQAIVDYRFEDGNRYNGPRIGGLDILSNFGVNLQIGAVSGRPYTQRIRPVRFGGTGTLGSLNGSRLPWRFNIDMRVDKSFALSKSAKNPLNLNVYFRVSNLLNRKNVIGVYSVTGSPTDDGYLASPEGQSVLSGVPLQGYDTQAYLASYSWALLNPDFFGLPRRMYMGAVIEF